MIMCKKLIALVTNNDDDVYCFRKELIKAIIDSGYEMLISCPDGPKFQLMKDIPFRYDDVYIDRRGTNVILDCKLLLHYFQLFRKNKPAVVLTYTAKPNVYAGFAAKMLGIPYICNVTGLGSVINQPSIMRAVILGMFRIAYRNAKCVMFQNASNMELAVKNGMVKGEYRLIPGSGVDTSRYPIQPYPEGGDGKNGEIVVFNYIGRILHDKGVDDYIAAAKQIKQNYPKTEFNLIGFIEPTEMHYKKELEELEREGVVFYRGSQLDVKPYIKRAHAIIHPSTYGEGMSNVLLENASSARPIITTDNPGCQEIVNNGMSGFIYHGGDVNKLTERIIEFLRLSNDERTAMGLAGRKKVQAEFERRIVVDAYLEQIKNCMRD